MLRFGGLLMVCGCGAEVSFRSWIVVGFVGLLVAPQSSLLPGSQARFDCIPFSLEGFQGLPEASGIELWLPRNHSGNTAAAGTRSGSTLMEQLKTKPWDTRTQKRELQGR